MVLIYVVSMAIAFSFYFGGAQVVFWYKYAIALLWAGGYLGPVLIRNRGFHGRNAVYIRTYIYPLFLILGWSLFIWVINPPEGLRFGNISRMISNIIYLMLAVSSAISTVYFFGRMSIKYSVWAIVLSILANLIYSTHLYGINILIDYLPQALSSTDFLFGSTLYNFGVALEVQDATLAIGFYILYFIFWDKDDTLKTRIFYVLLLLSCSYIGFKRTQFLAMVFSSLLMWGVSKYNISENVAIKVIGISFIVFSYIYIFIVKVDLFQNIVDVVGANVTGRQNVYRNLASYYEFSPVYLGKGFTYVDKTMYDTTGFSAHNTIIRMFAELGCFPFFLWIYWYLIGAPQRFVRKFGREEGLVALLCTSYLFFTYCIGNSMNFYCIQYSFMLIPIAVSCPNLSTRYKHRKLRFRKR